MKPEKKEEFKLHLAELFSYLHKELKLKSVPKVYLMEEYVFLIVVPQDETEFAVGEKRLNDTAALIHGIAP